MKHRTVRALTLCLLLVLLSTLLLGCGYKPKKSTEREATPVFSFGEETVNLEVLQTFFFSRCERRGIDAAVFSGEGGEERFATVMDETLTDIAKIYALFALCREVGIDPASEEIEEEITEMIKVSVKGGIYGDQPVEGHGSYKKYLAYLRENLHMNDAVNRLMLRYAICENKLATYYEQNPPYTEDDVGAFFISDECLYIAWASRYVNSSDMDRAENISLLLEAQSFFRAGNIRAAIQRSVNQIGDFYLSRHSLDEAYYAPLINRVFAMEIGDTSDIIDLGSEGYFVVHRLPKDPEHLDDRYREIAALYRAEVMYGGIDEIATSYMQGIVYKDAFHSLTADEILTMD